MTFSLKEFKTIRRQIHHINPYMKDAGFTAAYLIGLRVPASKPLSKIALSNN